MAARVQCWLNPANLDELLVSRDRHGDTAYRLVMLAKDRSHHEDAVSPVGLRSEWRALEGISKAGFDVLDGLVHVQIAFGNLRRVQDVKPGHAGHNRGRCCE